jgi:ABC-type transport system involved in multi-copper enzyme maturation permease subunit
MLDLRLISAEVLKLRRRRGMLVLAALLTLGVALLMFAVAGIQHTGDPARYRPAGGVIGYDDTAFVLTMMATVIGVIVGGTAGTQDIESGVFRDLAATGRSRLALFSARVTGAWAVVLSILAVTMAATAVLSIALAGSAITPDADMVASRTVGVLVAGALSTAMAVGLSALVGSRGAVIGVLLAFFLAVQALLLNVGFLGATRQGIPAVAIDRIADVQARGGVHVALGTAIIAVIAWGVAALGLGAWKTKTREI